jgi:hypothetical protein
MPHADGHIEEGARGAVACACLSAYFMLLGISMSCFFAADNASNCDM